MNKKMINLAILLVFIFSCNVSIGNNNIDVKPTTSVSSITSVLPTVTPSVQITTNPTNITIPSPSVSPSVEITPSPIPSPTITPTPTIIATPYVEIRNFEQNFQLNKERDGIENGYDGKVLIIIDTYLLKEYIKSEEELNRMKRKVMILKESYDELSEYEKEQLKKEYGDYTIFDPNTYKPIIEGSNRRDSSYEGELPLGTTGYKLNEEKNVRVYRGIYCSKVQGADIIPITEDKLNNPYSKNLKYIYENIKKSNKKKLIKSPVQKIVFCSISSLSYYSDYISYTVNFFDYLERVFFDYYPRGLDKKSSIWGIFYSSLKRVL